MKFNLFFLLLFSAGVMQGREITAVYTSVPPVIDGYLSEESWQKANASKEFTRFASQDLADWKSSVKILCDAEHIYFGVECQTSIPISCSEPEALKEPLVFHTSLYAASSRRYVGFDYGEGDKIEVFLSPGLEPDKYFQFIVSTTGKVFSVMATGDLFHVGNLPWSSAVAGGDRVFTVEVAIPWAIFHLEKTPVDWTINVCRVSAPPSPEASCWNPGLYAFRNTKCFGKLNLPEEMNLNEFVLAFKDSVLITLPPVPLQWRARVNEASGQYRELSGKISTPGLLLDPYMAPGALLELEISRISDGKILFQGAHQTEDVTKESK